MSIQRICLSLLFFAIISVLTVSSEEFFLREDFENLDSWGDLFFEKIPLHTEYSIKTIDGEKVLSIRSDSSASGIVFKNSFNVFENPFLEWRWMATNVLENGDARQKKGDDFPLRVYVIFRYDPDKASFGMKLQYNIAKRRTGEYPPHASLNYIWANRSHDVSIMPNAYTSRSLMIVMDSGQEGLGQWRVHRVNVLEDYRQAFGEDPPSEASLAIIECPSLGC